ncbi:MAG: hypothetical protein QM778_27990 [Myxococcales bacterium]
MALTRRKFLIQVPLAAALFSACGARQTASQTGRHYAELGSTAGAGRAERVLVCMPDNEHARQVWTGLCDELSADIQLIGVLVQRKQDSASIHEAITRHRPSALVLINNPTVAAYREYQRANRAASYPPAVIVMTSLLEQKGLGILNATGIRYEVPLITVVSNLRSLITHPVARVGVIRRAAFTGLVEFEATLAKRENVSVVSQVVSPSPNPSEIKAALRRLKHQVDALWVLNDDHLLTRQLLSEGWVAGLEEHPYIPTLVGARSLVTAGGSFGDFAVLPDHTALGTQAAGILFDARDNGWAFENTEVQLPVSTTTVMDYLRANELFALREDALSKVDVVLK